MTSEELKQKLLGRLENNSLSIDDIESLIAIVCDLREALEVRRQDMSCEACTENFYADGKAFTKIDVSLKRLGTQANETIKSLRHEMRMQGGAVEREAKANARIQILEASHSLNIFSTEIVVQLREREQKLLADVNDLKARLAARDLDAKQFCKAYDDALGTIVELKKRLGEDPGDY